MDYRTFPVQNIINSGNIQNSLNRILELQKSSGIELIHPTTVMTPPHIVDEMLDALPPEVWNHETTFLNMGCKNGIFLVKIFQRLMKIENNAFTTDTEKAWHILEKQLYAVCVDETIGKMFSTLMYGTSGLADTHVTWLNTSIGMKTNFEKGYFERVILGRLNKGKEVTKEMKFDVVIGNPPYNDTDTKVATAIYSKFITKAIDISKSYVSFIVPARWYSGGRGLDSLRALLLSKKHLRQLTDFSNEADVFPNVSIAGGVCYFIYDTNYIGDCKVIERAQNNIVSETYRDLSKHEVFIRDIKALKIIDKIALVYNSNTYMDFGVQSVDYFSVKDNPFIRSIKHSDEDIPIIDSSGTLYAERQHLTDPKNLIDSYNVMVTHAVGGEGYVIPKTISVLNIGEACSVTYLCIGATSHKDNAVNLMNYIKTKFCRFLMNQAISGINISAKSFIFVPQQDFTSNSDIDWSQSIADIDQQLYKKYNLTEEEIDYIEKTIKPMN